jgi:hypothetical protein
VPTKTLLNLETGEILESPRFTCETPFKKPKAGELSQLQEEHNDSLASWRVRIEHCIGWAKNWKILSTRFRTHRSLYTLIMQVVCGLVNAQTNRWQDA